MGTYDHSKANGQDVEASRTISPHDDEIRAVVVRLEGHLDMHTARGMTKDLKSILQGSIERLEIDMGQLRSIDSSGLRSLLWLRTEARKQEIDFRLTAVSPTIKRVIGPAGLRLQFSASQWEAFVMGVRRGEFESPAAEAGVEARLVFQVSEAPRRSRDPDTLASRNDLANPHREQTVDVGVDVYLDTDNDDEIDVAMAEVDHLVRTLGYESSPDASIERGSIFKRWKARSQGTLSSDEMRRRLAELEQALSIRLVQKDRAEVTSVEADAMARLIDSLTPIPCACIRINDYVVVKVQQDDGPVVSSRKLNDTELRAVEKYPEIQKTPDKFFDLLATAVDELDPPDEINPATATG